MSPVVIYDVPHQESFGALIALYIFFTGLSAGSFFVSTLSYGFGLKQYRGFSKPAIVTATLMLVAAPLFLLVHVGQPLRAWHLFWFLNPGSPITWGSFLLTTYPLFCVIYGASVFLGRDRAARSWGLAGIPFAVAVHGYTGFILSFCASRPLWHSSMVPLLFLVSAVVSGTALMILIFAALRKLEGQDLGEASATGSLILSLGRILGWILLVDLMLTGAEMLVGSASGGEGRRAVGVLLQGDLAGRFVGVEMVLGKLLPLPLLLSGRLRRVWTVLAASLLIVVGILFMRLDLVAVGEFFPLL
ncbi:MAG: NrfD/PsrC family molybdoenzyme membrane anchor subunit [bacterium]